jgi:hypothetical protein
MQSEYQTGILGYNNSSNASLWQFALPSVGIFCVHNARQIVQLATRELGSSVHPGSPQLVGKFKLPLGQ